MTRLPDSGECPHVLTVWVRDYRKTGPREVQRPALVRCRVRHDLRDEKPWTHVAAGGQRWR